jgi:hypothetical protein
MECPVAPEMNAGARVVEDAVGRVRVQELEVVGLEEVVDEHFHVARDVKLDAVHEPQIGERQVTHVARDRIEEFVQRLCRGVFTHEHPVGEALTAHRQELSTFDGGRRPVTLVGHTVETALTVVGPAVVAAHQQLAGVALGGAHDRCTAMPTSVVKGADFTVVAANDEDRGAAVTPHEEASRLG